MGDILNYIEKIIRLSCKKYKELLPISFLKSNILVVKWAKAQKTQMAYEHKEQKQTNKMCVFLVIKELYVKAV